jgi:DNA-binding IclR family transcriptional regulator
MPSRMPRRIAERMPDAPAGAVGSVIPDTPGRAVGSVARALALLDELAGSETALGVSELARRIGVNASTASRLLGTLEHEGFVEREPRGPYRLGLKLVTLADRALARFDVRAVARPYLETLVASTGETATLSVPGEGAAVTIDFVPSGSAVASVARLGRPSVAHATAAGKVMLAFAGGGAAGGAGRPAAEAAGELVAFTERTITDPRELQRQLNAAREQGFADAVGEREPDLAALAAPILGRAGELVAILGLQGPASRLTTARRRMVRPALLDAAAAISGAIGGPGPRPG